MDANIGSIREPLEILHDGWCTWCEKKIDPEIEEIWIRRYLASGGWFDIWYHPLCAAGKLENERILGTLGL